MTWRLAQDLFGLIVIANGVSEICRPNKNPYWDDKKMVDMPFLL